jgi:hypothetical protein
LAILGRLNKMLLTAEILDISGDQLAALDTKSEKNLQHMHPEVNQFMCVKRLMAREQLRLEKHLTKKT